VKIGLELTEEEAQSLCAQKSSLCEEKKAQAKLIRDTYPDLLRQSDYVEKAPLEQAPQQVAAEAAKPGDDQTASPQVRLGSRDTIRSVQKGLQRLGYDIGVADGKIGKRTTAAIRKYEKDNGMRVTGKISKALLVSLQKKAGVQ
jgi:lysozyme family protein